MKDLTTQLVEDLRKWVKEKWVDIGAPKKGGGYKPCGRSEGEKRKGYPKCVPAAKAAGMSKKQKKSAVRRKRAAGNPGGKPTMVSTFKKANKKREAFDLFGQVIEGKLCPKGKAAAKRKYDVYPSAYANMYASAVCSGKVKPGGKKKREAYEQLGDVILNELRGKYASKRYFDNERKGKRSDRKTYRGHIKFQAKRDDDQARGKIAPPGRGYDDEPETNPNR